MIFIEKLRVLRQITGKKCLIGIVAIIFRCQAQTVNYAAGICINHKNRFISGIKQDGISSFRPNPMDIQKLVQDVADADAAAFVDEFPGQSVKGDWDSEAWQIATGAGGPLSGLSHEEQDRMVGVYFKHLHEAIEDAAE